MKIHDMFKALVPVCKGLAGWRLPKRSRHSGVGAGFNTQVPCRSSLASLALTLFLAAPAFAHEDGKGPHGGVVKEFGSFHVEGVLNQGSLKFYLLGGDGVKSASAEVSGGAVTVLSGGSPKVTPIEKGTFSETSVAAEGHKLTATLMLKIGGKAQTAKFTFK